MPHQIDSPRRQSLNQYRSSRIESKPVHLYTWSGISKEREICHRGSKDLLPVVPPQVPPKTSIGCAQ